MVLHYIVILRNQKKIGNDLQKVVKNKVINYYCPTDEVLKYSHQQGLVKNPLGLVGSLGKSVKKLKQKRIFAKNHRFASYSVMIKSFP